MTYELIERGGHVCKLPDVSEFNDGDVITCTELVLRWGRDTRCGLYWERYTTFWSRVPYWRFYQGGY